MSGRQQGSGGKRAALAGPEQEQSVRKRELRGWVGKHLAAPRRQGSRGRDPRRRHSEVPKSEVFGLGEEHQVQNAARTVGSRRREEGMMAQKKDEGHVYRSSEDTPLWLCSCLAAPQRTHPSDD